MEAQWSEKSIAKRKKCKEAFVQAIPSQASFCAQRFHTLKA